ncbi:MAG: DUF6468 domain-containing protein [Pseudomonadota bacterium]
MLALDVLLLVMIGVCVAYCWVLNKRIQDLHNSRVEFARMIKEFDVAVVKADKAIAEMSILGKETGAQMQVIQKSLKESERTYTELHMASELGNKIAERLERNITEARSFEKIDAFRGNQSDKQRYDKEDQGQSTSEDREHLRYERRDESRDQIRDQQRGKQRDDDYLQESVADDKALSLQHKNELENILKRIVTNTKQEAATLTQNDYYDTLRRISARK